LRRREGAMDLHSPAPSGFIRFNGEVHSMRKLAVAFLFLLSVSTTLNAQYFGRNKVQWEQFDFKVLKTEHFDIYYYDREADVVNDVGRQAERWYTRLSRTFNHTFNRKPIVLYANSADFQQTTTTPEMIGEGTGGFTDPFMNRVVLPLTGDYAENDHVLGHEMVHVFQFDIAASITNSRRRFNLEMMPLWIVEGMAEYFSKGRVDPLTSMWIRDAEQHNRMPNLRQLERDPYYFPYRYGQALLAYIGGRFGDDAVVRYFLSAGMVNPEAAFDRALGVPAKQVFTDWQESAHEIYAPIVADRPAEPGTPLIGSKKGVRGNLNVGPAYSPDGKYIAFLSTRAIFDIDLFLADAQSGKVLRRLASSDRNGHFEALRFVDSAGSWSADSRKLAFITFQHGDNYLGIVDVDSGKVDTLKVPGIDAITSVAWSPDGKTMVIAGQATGVSDLFLFDTESKEVHRLTNDKYADLQPAFSPDGRTIAFVSDRGTGPEANLEQLYFQGMRISTIEISSSTIKTLPLFTNAKNINPQYGPDGSIYFIANPEGIADIYRYSPDGHVNRVTRVQTGVSGITDMSPALSVAQRTGDITFSLYENDNYNIYRLNANPPTIAVETAATAASIARAGQLPPLRGTGSTITAYMQNPAEGLLPASTVFQQTSYKPSLHIAYLGPPTVGVGVSSFGTGVGGSVSAYYSDVLGYHNIGVTFQGGGTSGVGTIADQLSGEVFYLNQRHRLNWGIDTTHLPYVTAFTSSGQAPVTINGQTFLADVIQQERDIQRYDDVSGIVQYPFSQTRRLEFSGGFEHQALKSEIETVFIVNNQIVSDTTDQSPFNFSLNLAHASLAFVGDSSTFGFLSPVRGTRYRYEAASYSGDLKFQTALADWRKYYFVNPVTFAVRGIYYGRYGADAESGRISPLYIGQDTLIHGYDINSIGLEECVSAPGSTACPVFDRLVGSRVAVGNVEIRVPVVGNKQFGLMSGFVPTEFFAFADAGAAWSKNDSVKFRFEKNNATDHIPVTSVGAGLRLLLAYIPLEFYAAKPFQRPTRNWVTGFNIVAGW
jgi:Tol biopolymer transport system component